MEHPALDTTVGALSKDAFPLTKEDFRTISAILHEDAGIFLSDAKETLVYSRLTKRLRALGLESFRQYCALVSSQEGVNERQQMIAALTTNVTKFFRDPTISNISRRMCLHPGRSVSVKAAGCEYGRPPVPTAKSPTRLQ